MSTPPGRSIANEPVQRDAESDGHSQLVEGTVRANNYRELARRPVSADPVPRSPTGHPGGIEILQSGGDHRGLGVEQRRNSAKTRVVGEVMPRPGGNFGHLGTESDMVVQKTGRAQSPGLHRVEGGSLSVAGDHQPATES
ncbi:hypothetical protein [Amycolatopsis sp. cmx-4-54]|uniref:hypothetical protein n=1 Tax=Amycolatopsis sp. cmx-4-54 TaxID=2790936 RepID=UPI00397DF21A